MDDSQQKYAKTKKGKKAITRAQKKYDEGNIEKRRAQKREYMRRKREREKMLELKKTE